MRVCPVYVRGYTWTRGCATTHVCFPPRVWRAAPSIGRQLRWTLCPSLCPPPVPDSGDVQEEIAICRWAWADTVRFRWRQYRHGRMRIGGQHVNGSAVLLRSRGRRNSEDKNSHYVVLYQSIPICSHMHGEKYTWGLTSGLTSLGTRTNIRYTTAAFLII